MILLVQINLPYRRVFQRKMHNYFAMIFMFFFSVFNSTPSIAQNDVIEIIAFGDSITAGLIRTNQGGVSCPPGVSLEPARFSSSAFDCYGNGVANRGGYQPILQSALNSRGIQTNIFNWGFSGIETPTMIGQLTSVLNSRPNAQYVLILGGANDAFEGFSTSTVVQNLQSMINLVRSRNMTPIIGTVTPITLSSSLDAITTRYSSAIKQLAQSTNTLIADHHSLMRPTFNSTPLHSGDRLHLNTAGNQVVASAWLEALDLTGPSAAIPAVLFLLLNDDD